MPDSIVYTDCFRAYDVLDVSDFHHVRINHSKLFAEDRNHINDIQSHHYHLYLKECEWRFN